MSGILTPSTVPAATPKPGDAGEALRKLAFAALGTTCEVQYVAPNGASQATRFEHAVVTWVSAFENRYSRFRPASLISRINEAAGHHWVETDEEMDRLLQLCDVIVGMTQGVLDPTSLPLLRLWNWKAEHPVIPIKAEIEAARQLVGWSKVQRSPRRIFLPLPGMALDFGGFGKEYAVDIVAQIALDHGIANALVDFGHDVRGLGAPPGRPSWHIGLEDPRQPGATRGSVALTGNRGIASSGDYVRRFELKGKRFGHIIDPRTGCPVAHGGLQATVIASNCLQAGILSTTAFVLGLPHALEFIHSFANAEGLIVTDEVRAQTRGFYRHVAS